MELSTPPGSQPSPGALKRPPPSPSESHPSNATITSDTSDDGRCSHIRATLADSASKSQLIQKYKVVVAWGANRRHDSRKEGPPAAKRRKMQAPSCSTCQSALHRPFSCLHCSFVGCLSHTPTHLQDATHQFAVDTTSGSIYCSECDDFIYDITMESIYLSCQQAAEGRVTTPSKFARETYKPWVPDEKDAALLKGARTVACRGRRGLLNLGSTCYLNVVLQTLIHNPLLRNYFLSDKHNHKLCDKKDCMCCEMDKLFAEIYSNNTTPHGPISFLHAAWQASSDLAGYAQQDAHEFLISALNQIHTNSKGSTNVSCNCIIHSTFAGQLQSDVKCGKCGQVRPTVDPMLDVSLELRGLQHESSTQNGAFTLYDCLRRFTREEKLGTKDYSCESCGTASHEATKRLSIRKLPPVLCFQLKRFEHKTSAQKIETPIRFPATLNMAPYTTLAAKRVPDDPGPDLLYDLFAVVNHEGQMDTGHYTNFARFQDEWYRFDDEKVSHSTLRECLASNAYMCIYVKRILDYMPNQRPSYVVSRESEAAKERERENEKIDKEIDEGLASLL